VVEQVSDPCFPSFSFESSIHSVTEFLMYLQNKTTKQCV
jgi:hypothetical protein